MSFNPRQDIGSPSFVYDKVYASYKDLIDNQSSDEIAIGRYVIVLYERNLNNNAIEIIQPDDETGYWDTAIFQKQYNTTNGEHYEFITYLGVFGDNPPTPNSIIFIDNDRNMIYSTQNTDNWIGIDTTGTTPKLTHKKISNTTGYTEYKVRHTDITNGIRLTYPVIKIDSMGHIVSITTATEDVTNIASLTVGTF